MQDLTLGVIVILDNITVKRCIFAFNNNAVGLLKRQVRRDWKDVASFYRGFASP